MKFNYFYGEQANQYSFIRVPKILMMAPQFSKINTCAKILYGLLLDRIGEALKNKWIDEKNHVYVIYPIKEIEEDLGITKRKAMKSLEELESVGLIEKKVRGFGMPNILYVKNFLTEQSRGNENETSIEEETYENKNDL